MKKILILIFLLLSISCDDSRCFDENTVINTDPSTIEMNWVTVEAGTFEMGCTAEQIEAMTYCLPQEMPVHRVGLDDYMISKFEVTTEQYVAFLNSQKVDCKNEVLQIDEEYYMRLPNSINIVDGLFLVEDSLKNHPIIQLSWYGAKGFCEWVGGRLPTDAEWEFAARGGNSTKGYVYSGSNNFEDVGKMNEDDEITYEIGSLAPNELGIFDMSGSAAEWCNDYYDLNYFAESPEINPQGPENGTKRSIRTYLNFEKPMFYGRVSDRYGLDPNSIYKKQTGCRCAKDI